MIFIEIQFRGNRSFVTVFGLCNCRGMEWLVSSVHPGFEATDMGQHFAAPCRIAANPSHLLSQGGAGRSRDLAMSFGHMRTFLPSCH